MMECEDISQAKMNRINDLKVSKQKVEKVERKMTAE